MEPPALAAGPAAPVRAAPGAAAELLLPPPVGTQPFTYHWSRAGASLDDRFTTSDDAAGVRLTVSAAQTGDSGVYTLQASNAAGSDTSKIRLEVSAEEAPTGEDPPTFLRRLQDLTVKVGSRTRFLVEIISSTECKVTWYRNERRLLEAERVALARDGNFWCADVAAVSVDDAGRWTCTAENAGGRASCSAHLNVLVPKAYKRPEFVEELRALLTEQGTVSLECKVVGVPTPVLRWFKDSREIKAGDVFALTANAEDPTSLGTYTCEAVNCMGRAYSSSKVHVVGRASREGSARPSSGGMTPEPPPIFTKELEDAHVKVSEHLTLGCHVVVPPWPRSVVWYNKEGKVEPGERYHTIEDGVGGYILEIPSVEWADEGEWKCVATSAGGRVGITTCYVAMDVPKNYRKPRFMENLQAVLTEEGLVSFECKVVGFPTPVLSWFKDGQELKPGDVYQLTGTNSLGSYCCIAKNCMGQASSSAELTIEDIQNQLNEEEKLQLFSKNQAPKFLQGLKSVEAKIDEPFRFTVKVAIPPEPSVLWYRDDQPVDESTRCHLEKEEKGIFNLDIQNLEFLDQAEWKCVAMNDFGHSVTSCFLKLIIPRHYKKPRFLENLQAILSDEGAVNLECKVIGVPQPVLKWYKDGEELKPGDIHRIISGQDGTCCLGTYTCEAQNCMGIAASSASLLGFDDSMKTKTKPKEEQPLQRNLSLSTIHEERTSQMYDTPVGDITLDDKGEISFSFDGKEVSVSLYETPDLTEEEALQIVEMYADQLSENVTEHNVVELPPLRFVKETSTSGNLLMEAIIIDVSPDYFTTPDEDLRTEADVEDLSIADENGLPQLSLDQEIDIGGEDYLERTMALMSEERSEFAAKSSRRKSDSQRSADDFFSLSRDQSLSEEKRDDDTHVSESELQSFASARSSAKVKSKSSKKSGEEGQESSELTKTVLLKDEITSKSSKNELTKQQDQQLDVTATKPKRERRTSRGSRRSSTSSEKSVGKSKEDLLRLKSELEQAPKLTMNDEEFNTTMNSISTSLTKVINDVQLIERDIILKSELMSSAATASRSLEIISSLINPLSEIHSIAEAAKESVSESREVTSTIFNSVQQPLKSLQQSLTIIEKCIDMESDNKTLVKKTCVAFVETCGMEVQNILAGITSVTTNNYIKTDDKVASEIDSVVSDMTTAIKFSAETIKTRNILSEAKEIKPEIPSLETKHLKDTQKAIFELKSPLNSLLRIVESAQSGNMIDLSKIKHSEVIMNDMSASIQDLQTALEQIESLSVKETLSSLHKHNTDIIETVMDSVIKLRGSFEQLSTEPSTEQDKTILTDTLSALKENLIEISNKIENIDQQVGKFDILQSENKLDVLQKMAQILIALENNLPRLESMPSVKSHMDSFHKNLTKVLENIIESNDAEKYQTMLEICDTISIMNSSIRNIDSVNTEDVLPLASLSNTLKIIETNLINNIIEPELNCRILNNISEVLVDVQEVINKAEDISLQIDSEYIQDLSSQIMNEEKVNIIIEHINQTIAAIEMVKTIENAHELQSTLTPALEYVCPILEELRKCVASVGSSGVEQDEHVSEIPDASFAQTIATPLCELNQSIIVLNQLIAENIDYIKDNTDIITAIAEPLHELHTTLEILQQDVVSQYREDLTPYDVSVNMASVVQNLQSCIVMIHEQAGIEGVEEMSTLEDISGIKTSADTLPSDGLVLPTAEETAIEQSYLPLNQEVTTTATATTLQSLNEHIMVLQTPDVIEALDTLSEISDYASLKSVIVNLGDLHTGIEGILHPVPIEGSLDLDDTTNISKLAAIAEPMHEIQQSLSVLDTSNIPVYENIIDLPSDKIHSVFQSISELKNSLEQCMCAVLPAMEIANTTIEISNKVSTLREVCEQLKDIFDTSKDATHEITLPKEVQSLEAVVKNLIDATNVSKDIKIDEVKSLTEELYLKVKDAQEDIIQFTAQSSEQLAQEAKLIQIVNEVETNIAVLEQYDFIDLSLASDLTSCTSPQLAVEIDSESLAQLDDIAGNAVNVLQDANQDIPIADLLVIEDFFKTCKDEFTILRCLITKASSHKKIIRVLQEFNSLQSLINNFTTKRLELNLSDDVNECLSNFLIHADDCLRNARNSLINVVESQSDMLIKVPISQLESLRELKDTENKTSEMSGVIKTLLDVADVSKHLENTLHSEIVEEISKPNRTAKPDPEEIILEDKMKELLTLVQIQTDNKNLDSFTANIFEELMKCISKHNYKDALGTGKTLIILKCLAECATIVQEELTKKKVLIKETAQSKAQENTLKDVLAEMLQPLQALHTELVNIQEQVMLGAEEDSISIDITTTESIMQTMTELHKDILHQIESDSSNLHSEDMPLLQEVDKEIHTIRDSINTMDNTQAVQAVIEITKPMEDIEKALQAVLSTERNISKEELSKEVSAELMNSIDQYIELIEIIEEISAVIKIDDIKETFEIARELRECMSLSEVTENKEQSSSDVAEQTNLVQKLQSAISVLQAQVLDSAHTSEPSLTNDALKRVAQVTAQLQENLVAVKSVQISLQAPSLSSDTLKLESGNELSVSSATLESVQVDKTKVESPQQIGTESIDKVEEISDVLKVEEEQLEPQSSDNLIGLVPSHELIDVESAKTFAAESINILAADSSTVEASAVKSSETDTLVVETTVISKDDSHQEKSPVEKQTPEDNLMQHIIEYVSEDIVQAVDSLTAVIDVEELKKSIHIANELRECIAATEVVTEDSINELKKPKDQQIQLIQSLETTLTALSEQTVEILQDLGPSESKTNIEKIAVIVENLKTDLESVKISQPELLQSLQKDELRREEKISQPSEDVTETKASTEESKNAAVAKSDEILIPESIEAILSKSDVSQDTSPKPHEQITQETKSKVEEVHDETQVSLPLEGDKNEIETPDQTVMYESANLNQEVSIKESTSNEILPQEANLARIVTEETNVQVADIVTERSQQEITHETVSHVTAENVTVEVTETSSSESQLVTLKSEQETNESFNTAKETLIQTMNLFLYDKDLHHTCKQHIKKEELHNALQIAKEINKFLNTPQITTSNEAVSLVQCDLNHNNIKQFQEVLESIQVQLLGNISEESPSLHDDVQSAANVIMKLNEELTSALLAEPKAKIEDDYTEDLVPPKQSEPSINSGQILTEATDDFVDCSNENEFLLQQKDTIEEDVPEFTETTKLFEEFFDSPTLADEAPSNELIATEVRELTVLDSINSIEKGCESTEIANIEINDSLMTAVTMEVNTTDVTNVENNDLIVANSDVLKVSLSQINCDNDLSSEVLVAPENLIVTSNEVDTLLSKITENVDIQIQSTLDSTAVIMTEDKSLEVHSELGDTLNAVTDSSSSTILLDSKNVAEREIQEAVSNQASSDVFSGLVVSTDETTAEIDNTYEFVLNPEAASPDTDQSTKEVKHEGFPSQANVAVILDELPTGPIISEKSDLQINILEKDVAIQDKVEQCQDSVSDLTINNAGIDFPKSEKPTPGEEIIANIELTNIEETGQQETKFITEEENNEEFADVQNDIDNSIPTDDTKNVKNIVMATPTVEHLINESISNELLISDRPSVEIVTSIQEKVAQENLDNITATSSVFEQSPFEQSPVRIESLYSRIEEFITSEDVSKVADELSSTSIGQDLEKSLQCAKHLHEIMNTQPLAEKQRSVMEHNYALSNTLSKMSDTASEFGSLKEETINEVINLSTHILDEINEVICISNEVLLDTLKEAKDLLFDMSDQDTVSENPQTDLSKLLQQCDETTNEPQAQDEDLNEFSEPNPPDEMVEASNQSLNQEPDILLMHDATVKPEQPIEQSHEILTQSINNSEDQSANTSEKLIISELDQNPDFDVVQNIEERRKLIDHINTFITEEVAEVVEEISNIANLETLKASISIAKQLRESLIATDFSATAEETTPLRDINILEQAKLAESLQAALSTWQSQSFENTEVMAPLLSPESVQRVSEIILHLQDDLGTVIVSDVAEKLKLGEIVSTTKIEEHNSMCQLETLLQDVNMKINSVDKPTDADDSESLRDTLDEVQTVIIKLKNEYDGATNDTLNETLDDLECSVRSVQLQINEESPSELLNEACATLQLLFENMNTAQQVQTTQISQKWETTEIVLDKCSKETEESVKLLDLAAQIDVKKCENLKSIVNNLKTIRDSLKTLRASFLVDADTVIENGVKIVEYLNQMEENIFSLEKEIENAGNLTVDTRDSILTAVHSVYGSISNMRGTVSSVQKRYMFENFGRPSESLLHSIKNVSSIFSSDEESNKASWKKLSKSLRKVLNHFEDIKFYINLDKTARLPSDAAFTKIILEELKDNIMSVLVPRAMLLDKSVLEKVNKSLKSVETYLLSIESESTLQVRNKIPMFKEISSEMLSTTSLIKNRLDALTSDVEAIETKKELESIEKQIELSGETLQAIDSKEDDMKTNKDKKDDSQLETLTTLKDTVLTTSEKPETSPIEEAYDSSEQLSTKQDDDKIQDLCEAEGIKTLEKSVDNLDTEDISKTIKHDENLNLEGLVTKHDKNQDPVNEQIEKSTQQSDTTQVARTEEPDEAVASTSKFLAPIDDDNDAELNHNQNNDKAGVLQEKVETENLTEETAESEKTYQDEFKENKEVDFRTKKNNESAVLDQIEEATGTLQEKEDYRLSQKDETVQNMKQIEDAKLTQKEEEAQVSKQLPEAQFSQHEETAQEDKTQVSKQEADSEITQKEEDALVSQQKVDAKLTQKEEETLVSKHKADDKHVQKEEEVLEQQAGAEFTQKEEKVQALEQKTDAEQVHKEEAQALEEKTDTELSHKGDEDQVSEPETDAELTQIEEKAFASKSKTTAELTHIEEDQALKQKENTKLTRKESETQSLKQNADAELAQKEDEAQLLKQKIDAEQAPKDQETQVLKHMEHAEHAQKEEEAQALKPKEEETLTLKRDADAEYASKELAQKEEGGQVLQQKANVELAQNEEAQLLKQKEEARISEEKTGAEKLNEGKMASDNANLDTDLNQKEKEDSHIKNDKQEKNKKERTKQQEEKTEAEKLKQEIDAAGKANLQQREDDARTLKEKAELEKIPETDATEMAKQEAEFEQKEEKTRAFKEKAENEKLKQENNAVETVELDAELQQKKEEAHALKEKEDENLNQIEANELIINEKAKEAKLEKEEKAEIKHKEEEAQASKESQDEERQQKEEESRASKEKAEKQDACEKAEQEAELKQKEEVVRALREKEDANLKQKEADALIKKEKAKKAKLEKAEKTMQDAEIKQKEEDALALKEIENEERKQKEEESSASIEKAEAENLKQERDASEQAKQEAEFKQKEEEERALEENAEAEKLKQERDTAEKAELKAELKKKEEEERALKEKAEAEKLKHEREAAEKAKQEAELKQKEEEARVSKEKTEAEKLKQERKAAEKAKQEAELKQKQEEARASKEKAEAEKLKQERDAAEKAKQEVELKQKEEEERVSKQKAEAEKLKQERDAAEKAKQEAELKQKEEEERASKQKAEAEKLKQERDAAEKAKQEAELKQKEEEERALKQKAEAEKLKQERDAAEKAKQEVELKQKEEEERASKQKAEAEKLKQERDAAEKAKQEAELKQKEEEERASKQKAEAEKLKQERDAAEKAKQEVELKQKEEEERASKQKAEAEKLKQERDAAEKAKQEAELKQKEEEERALIQKAEAEKLKQERDAAEKAKEETELKQKEEEERALIQKAEAKKLKQERDAAEKAKQEAELKQKEKEERALKQKAEAEKLKQERDAAEKAEQEAKLKKKEEQARALYEKAEAEKLKQEREAAEKAEQEAELKQKEEEERALKQKAEAEKLKQERDAAEKAKQEAELKQKVEEERALKEKAEAEKLKQERDAAEKAEQEAKLKKKEEQARALNEKAEAEKLKQEREAEEKAEQEAKLKKKEEKTRALKEKAEAEKAKQEAELKQKQEEARASKEKAEAEKLKQESDAAEKAKQEAELKKKEEEKRALKEKAEATKAKQEAELKQKEEEARALKEKEDADLKQKEKDAQKRKSKKAKLEKARQEAEIKQKEEEAQALREIEVAERKQKEEEYRVLEEKAAAHKLEQERDDAEKAKQKAVLKQKAKEDRELKQNEDSSLSIKKEKAKVEKLDIKKHEDNRVKNRDNVHEVEAQTENNGTMRYDAKRSRVDEVLKKSTKYTEKLSESERRDEELHIYKEDTLQTKKENGITNKTSQGQSDEQHYIKEYQYQPSRTDLKLEARERAKFIDHNHRDYTMEFARPSGYRERSFDVDKFDSTTSHDYLGKNAAIYRAQTLVLDSQIRSTTPLLLDHNTSRTSEPFERRSEIRQRSKAHSEARTITSEKRSSASRDSKRKPVFSTYLTDRTAVEGSRVKLTCSVLSSSDPTVTWYKNGVLLDNKLKYRTKFIDGLITLEVLNAVPSDSAEYSCTIQNENGSINSSANLKVYPSFEASPIPPTFTRSIRDTYHLAENELVLECRIRGQPLPTITWLKDNKPISDNSRYQAYYLADGVCRLAIEHPTPEDSGKYTCKAENSVWSDQITHVVNFTGKESRQGPNIATIEKSRFNRQAMESRRPHFTNVLSDYKVVTGGTIGLQVEIRGAPTRVEWLREGCSVTEVYRNAKTFVEQELYTLALSDVTEKESGMYTCRAWSSQSHVDMNAAITVVQPNELDGKPAVIVGRPDKDILISIGEDINISFRVQGEPKPKVVFMKGIRDITTSQRVCKMTSDDYVKFTLKRSVISDAGTYCILARNAYGVDRAFVTVVVRQRASSDNLISDWTYPVDDSSLSVAERKYKSVPERIPGEPSVLEGGNNWISLGWPKSEPGQSAPVLAYKVESWLLGKDGGARWSELGITPLNSFDAFNLKQGEEYHFRVTPRNRYGWGESVQTSSPISVGLAGDRPEFTESLPGQLKVLVGETANLSCSVKGTPAPEVVWMKNGHEIEDEDRRISSTFNGFNCSLTIKDISIEDEARYSCEAANLHGRASTYARLAVVTDRSIWEADAKLKRERSADVDGDYPPQFTMRLRDRRVQATYPVRLTCQVIGSPDPRITWFKDGFEIKPDNRRSHFQDEHFHTLEIAPTNLEDGGVYEAMARNSSGAVSCRCSLVVDKGIRAYVAPEFCCGLEPLYRLTDGEELRISAVVEAYPSVGVTWYRDGVRLRPSRRAIMTLDRDGQIELALAAVTSRDAGVYSCTASNEVGRASTSGKVEVIGSNVARTPPVFISPDEPYSKEPMFIRKPRSSEAREGDTVIIACEVVGDPKPDVYWLRDFLKPDYYRDSSHFKRMGDGPEYRFEIPHAKLDYTGAYSVVARNQHGEAKAIISLQILAKDPDSTDEAHNIRYGRVEVLPRFSKELTDLLSCDGDAVEFECHLTGNPEPNVRWFHYQELIRDCPDFETSFEDGAARLKIKQVTAEDEGTYSCEASNNLGKATSSACLVVYPPGEPNTLSQRLRRPPAFLSAASTPRSTPRSTPARSVSRTPGPETRRLCSPARTLAPSFYTYPFNKVVEEGETVTLQCAIKGNPSPWATWDKDGVIITPSSRITIKEKDDVLRILEIEQVTIDDVGVYRITIENEFGRQEASARIEVITQKGKFYAGVRAVSPSPRKTLTYRNRRPSTPRQD